ncbi:hypothetical protein [Streptococcus merionis]|uniref:hypothetical protein n=1 Tax=Streptococcus merionis TaxID=400065 RepID=UPI00351291DB
MKKKVLIFIGFLALFVLVGCSPSLDGTYYYEKDSDTAEMTIDEYDVDLVFHSFYGTADYSGTLDKKSKTITGTIKIWGIEKDLTLSYEVKKDGLVLIEEDKEENPMVFIKEE